jgi:hypothetical protein
MPDIDNDRKTTITSHTLLLLAALLSTGVTKAALGADPAVVSTEEATAIAREAMKKYHPGVSIDLMPGQLDPGFYDFEAMDANPTGSPLVGHFAVNEVTGDIWDLGGHCKHLTSPNLRKLQHEIRRRLNLRREEYLRGRARKPDCYAD